MYLKESFDALSRDAEIKYVRPAVRVAQKYFEWTWSTPPLDTVSKRSYLGMFIAFICLYMHLSYLTGGWSTYIISCGKARSWSGLKTLKVDWEKLKKCFCVVIFVVIIHVQPEPELTYVVIPRTKVSSNLPISQ